jgi:hypothetical protein
MNARIEAGESPLLFQPFTGRNGSWTMFRDNSHGVKTHEYIPGDIGSGSQEAAGLNIASKFEFQFGSDKVRNDFLLLPIRIWSLELVKHEEKLTKMLYSIWISVFQEHTIWRKDPTKVRLQECRYTSTLVSLFELTWYSESEFYQSKIESFA